MVISNYIMQVLEIEVHDDDWLEVMSWCDPEDYEIMPSSIGIQYTGVRITRPDLIVFFQLKYPWIHLLDVV